MSTSDASNLRQRRGHASAADSSKSGNAAANGKLEDKPILELLESPAMPWYLRPDALIAWAFLLVGAISRFYDIGEPRLIVFDETHFTKFLTWYWSGHYFVDIHPPLAKGVFALVLKYLTDFKGAREDHVKWWTNDGFVGTNDWKLLYEQVGGGAWRCRRWMDENACSLLYSFTSTTALHEHGRGPCPSVPIFDFDVSAVLRRALHHPPPDERSHRHHHDPRRLPDRARCR